MATALYEWFALGYTKHAWVRQSGEYVSLCNVQFKGQALTVLSGDEMTCALCAHGVQWYEKTGQKDYLKPHHGDLMKETRDATSLAHDA